MTWIRNTWIWRRPEIFVPCVIRQQLIRFDSSKPMFWVIRIKYCLPLLRKKSKLWKNEYNLRKWCSDKIFWQSNFYRKKNTSKVKQEKDVARTLNNCFLNLAWNLNMLECYYPKNLFDDAIMKPVLKLWDHPILLFLSENHVKIENRPKQGKKGQIAFLCNFFSIKNHCLSNHCLSYD